LPPPVIARRRQDLHRFPESLPSCKRPAICPARGDVVGKTQNHERHRTRPILAGHRDAFRCHGSRGRQEKAPSLLVQKGDPAKVRWDRDTILAWHWPESVPTRKRQKQPAGSQPRPTCLCAGDYSPFF
jgi:hypothetical protein